MVRPQERFQVVCCKFGMSCFAYAKHDIPNLLCISLDYIYIKFIAFHKVHSSVNQYDWNNFCASIPCKISTKFVKRFML